MGRFTIATLAALLLLSGCKQDSEDGIPIVGVDERGRTVTYYVETQQYIDEMAKVFSETHDSVLTSLATTGESGSWNLQAVSVGLGAAAKFEIPLLVSLGRGGRTRLLFTRQNNPDVE